MLNTFVAIHWEREKQGTRSNNTKTQFTQLHIGEQEPTLPNSQDHISGSMLSEVAETIRAWLCQYALTFG